MTKAPEIRGKTRQQHRAQHIECPDIIRSRPRGNLVVHVHHSKTTDSTEPADSLAVPTNQPIHWLHSNWSIQRPHSVGLCELATQTCIEVFTATLTILEHHWQNSATSTSNHHQPTGQCASPDDIQIARKVFSKWPRPTRPPSWPGDEQHHLAVHRQGTIRDQQQHRIEQIN